MINLKNIDINSDLGEGLGNDADLMPHLSSCNIACGGHFGDLISIKETILIAKDYNVKIGAHPSYPDKLNFGREELDISDNELIDSLKSQLSNILGVISEDSSLKLNHIKAHGALYNKSLSDFRTAKLFVDFVTPYDVPIYAPYNSLVAKIAESNGVKVLNEVFLDRNYNVDGSLVSRKLKNAMFLDVDLMLERIISVLKRNELKTPTGELVFLKADTFCIHGDTENSSSLLKTLKNNMLTY